MRPVLFVLALLAPALDPPRPRSSPSRAARCGRWRSRPDGTRLFAVNTPDNRLEIFDVDAAAA